LEALTGIAAEMNSEDTSSSYKLVGRTIMGEYTWSGRDIRNLSEKILFEKTRVLSGNEGDILPDEVRRAFFSSSEKVTDWLKSVFSNRKISLEEITKRLREYVAHKKLQEQQEYAARVMRVVTRKILELDSHDLVATMLKDSLPQQGG